jgi:hypothetical protein
MASKAPGSCDSSLLGHHDGKERFMDHIWTRVATNLVARVSGPMKFRLLLQPLSASFFAIRSGLADARAGKPPYFWALFTDPGEREDMIKNGWKSIGKLCIFAFLLDVLYQIIEIHFVYPGEAIIVAIVLAILPYLILRGPVNRLARMRDLRRQRDRQTTLGNSQ